TNSQKEAVRKAKLQTNYSNCVNGLTWSCDKSLLTAAQVKAISASEKHTTQPSISNGACAENGSCYGDISNYTGKPKTVHVNGYYRKDGTYVRGHYRSK
ncbi:hypothetical protein, partial [Vibrio sp. 704]|uniref:hypothetical protein n=1 Tax=Vibrio sp. 704 TaxID=3074610 RepID=UPI002964548F